MWHSIKDSHTLLSSHGPTPDPQIADILLEYRFLKFNFSKEIVDQSSRGPRRCRYHATSSWGHTNVVSKRHTSFCCVFLHFPIFLVGPRDRAKSWGLASPRPCCTVRSCPSCAVFAEQGVSRKRTVLQVGTGVLKRAEGWPGRELPGRAGSEHSMTGGGLG